MNNIQQPIGFFQKQNALQSWGPIFLLCTVALAVKDSIPSDFFFVALVGFFLSICWQMKGFVYAILLLAIGSAFKHFFYVSEYDNHFWEAGLEGSLACAFLITALVSEKGVFLVESLYSQTETRKAALQNVEEELSKLQETAISKESAFQEKIASLKKELEEVHADHSSLSILNEVLRKTSARHAQDNEKIFAASLAKQQELDSLKKEWEEIQKELIHLKNTDPMIAQNEALKKEIKTILYEKAQVHSTNETLSYLHEKEKLSAKEAIEQANQIQEELTTSQMELKTYASLVDQLSKDLGQLRENVAQLTEIRMERNFLQERLNAANGEIVHLKQKVTEIPQDNQLAEKLAKAERQISHTNEKLKEIQIEKDFFHQQFEGAKMGIADLELKLAAKPVIDPLTGQQLVYAQEKIHELSQIEPLFKQLKKQFDEKNQILHQVRRDLFKSDTELQKLKMEKEALELNPVPKEVEADLDALTKHISEVEKENHELHQVITLLSGNSQDLEKLKKKG